MLNDSPVGCQTRAVTEPQRDGGICEANDGEVFKTATFKPLSHGFADTSLYTREAIRCGGEGPMSTRKGQAASVTLLRREQLRSASAPTDMSEVQRGGEG